VELKGKTLKKKEKGTVCKPPLQFLLDLRGLVGGTQRKGGKKKKKKKGEGSDSILSTPFYSDIPGGGKPNTGAKGKGKEEKKGRRRKRRKGDKKEQ